MNKTVHNIYISTMALVTILVTIYLFYIGSTYYSTVLEERYYHPQHDWFKPSGIFGHGLGIIGTFLILFGVVIYILHKRYNILGKKIRLKYLLEFHIFLCVVGPIMILFHTAFKFGGIVSIAFWSMVVVVLSGVVGRFIYIQIPRTIEGRELTLNEVQSMKSSVSARIIESAPNNEQVQLLVGNFISDKEGGSSKKQTIRDVSNMLKSLNILKSEQKTFLKMMKEESSLASRIQRLQLMQRLFKYWHVAHLPFAVIMLIIVIIHTAVSLTFGQTWIF